MKRRLWNGLIHYVRYSMLIRKQTFLLLNAYTCTQTPTVFLHSRSLHKFVMPGISDYGIVSRDSSLGMHYLLVYKATTTTQLSYCHKDAGFRIDLESYLAAGRHLKLRRAAHPSTTTKILAE
jgi:hypothetical protein